MCNSNFVSFYIHTNIKFFRISNSSHDIFQSKSIKSKGVNLIKKWTGVIHVLGEEMVAITNVDVAFPLGTRVIAFDIVKQPLLQPHTAFEYL